MNCQNCGTPLAQGARHCFQCGSVVSDTDSTTVAGPDAATVVSTSGEISPPPPPLNDHSPAYQRPYDPYNVGGPKRRGSRAGVILAIILIFVIVAGGLYAWTRYSASTNTTATQNDATPTAVVHHFTAQGTDSILDRTNGKVQKNGDDTTTTLTEHALSKGDIVGQITNTETDIQHADKTVDFSGKSICLCTVSGKSGRMTWSYSGTTSADGKSQGRFFDIEGKDDLEKLHGEGTLQGQGDQASYSGDLYFAP